MSDIYNINKFNFQKNQWLYFYLQKFVFNNKSIKSLNDIKELSIDLLDSIFRKKGFSKHKRENWLLCAQSNKCSNQCRDSNGFKTDYEKKIKSIKCVPKTRKLNPKYKNKDYLNYNSDYQYAYLFLKNYNSIIYTLNEYNSNDLKKDEVLKSLSSISPKTTNSITEITKVYDIHRTKQYNELTKKIERFYPDIKKRRENLSFKSYKPKVLDYESEFDKLAKKLRLENQNKTKKTGGKKRSITKKNRSSFFFF